MNYNDNSICNELQNIIEVRCKIIIQCIFMNLFVIELYCNCIRNSNMFGHLFHIRFAIIIEVRLEVHLQFEYNRKAIHESICHRVIIAIVFIIATCLCIYFKLDSRL